MTPSALLSRLSELGVKVCAQGDRLRLEGSGEKPSPGLLEEIRTHREEILTLVRKSGTPAVGDVLGGVAAPQTAGREVTRMALAEFTRAQLVIVVTSHVLRTQVVLASDNAAVDPGERRTVYRAAELTELLGLAPEHLRQIHRVKTVFGGSILPS